MTSDETPQKKLGIAETHKIWLDSPNNKYFAPAPAPRQEGCWHKQPTPFCKHCAPPQTEGEIGKQHKDKCPTCGKNMKLQAFDYVQCPLGHRMTIEAAEHIRQLEARNTELGYENSKLRLLNAGLKANDKIIRAEHGRMRNLLERSHEVLCSGIMADIPVITLGQKNTDFLISEALNSIPDRQATSPQEK